MIFKTDAAHHDNGGRPDHFVHRTTNYPTKLKVFLGLKGDGSTFSLKFLDQGKITSESYYKLLRYNSIPKLKAGNGGTLDDLWWQQDWASPRRAVKVMKYLDNQFNGLPGHQT